jgi:hypothetical protein
MKRPEVAARVTASRNAPEKQENLSKILKETRNRPEVKSKIKVWDSDYNPMNDAEMKKSWYEKMISDRVWEKRQENYTPKRHGMYDHTIYEFIHEDGTIERCQRYELEKKYNLSNSKLSMLVRGKRNSHKGWRLLVV